MSKDRNIDRLKELADSFTTKTVIIDNSDDQCVSCPVEPHQLPCNCPMYPIREKITQLEQDLSKATDARKIKLYEDIIRHIKFLTSIQEVA